MKTMAIIVAIWLVFFAMYPVHTLIFTLFVSIVGGVFMTSGNGDMGGGRW